MASIKNTKQQRELTALMHKLVLEAIREIDEAYQINTEATSNYPYAGSCYKYGYTSIMHNKRVAERVIALSSKADETLIRLIMSTP